MAQKKKKATKKSAAKKSTKKPSISYEELLEARRALEDAHSSVRQAERELRSAKTINTFAQRDEAVVIALDNLNQARSKAAEAAVSFEELKVKARNS